MNRTNSGGNSAVHHDKNFLFVDELDAKLSQALPPPLTLRVFLRSLYRWFSSPPFSMQDDEAHLAPLLSWKQHFLRNALASISTFEQNKKNCLTGSPDGCRQNQGSCSRIFSVYFVVVSASVNWSKWVLRKLYHRRAPMPWLAYKAFRSNKIFITLMVYRRMPSKSVGVCYSSDVFCRSTAKEAGN